MKCPVKTFHKLNFAHVLLCSYTLLLLGTPVSVQALTLPETAKLVPSDTVVLIEIDDFSRLKEQFEETNFYRLYKDPAIAPFFDNLKKKWREKSRTNNDKNLGLLRNVDKLPDGRVAFAVVLNEKLIEAKDPPFVLIIQWGQNANKIKEAVDEAVKMAVEDGNHRKSENYRGADITTIISKSSKTYHFCFIEDCLTAAIDLDVLKFVIAHIQGASSPSLADDADYSSTKRVVKLQDAEQIDCFVNIKQLIKTVINTDTKGEIKTIINNLGLDNVTSFGFSLGLGASSSASAGSSSGKAFLNIKGQKKGLTKLFELESAPLRTPPFISNSAYAVSFVNFNFNNAYSELVKILTNFSPQYASMLYIPLIPPSSQGEPPVQIKSGVIDHLGSQIVIAQSINEPVSGADTAGQETSLVAIATHNRNALEKSLSLLHSKILAANNPNASRQLLGHTLYLLDFQGFLPGLMSPPKQPMQNPYGRGAPQGAIPQMPKFAFTVTDTHLIFSTEPAVENAIRTLNSSDNISVGTERWFNIAKSAIPSLAGFVTLQNDAVSGKYIWAQLRNISKQAKDKNNGSNNKLGVGVRPGSAFPKMMFEESGIDLFDFSLLPEFDEVKKYFGLSTLYGISRPDGFFFEFKYLNPPSEN